MIFRYFIFIIILAMQVFCLHSQTLMYKDNFGQKQAWGRMLITDDSSIYCIGISSYPNYKKYYCNIRNLDNLSVQAYYELEYSDKNSANLSANNHILQNDTSVYFFDRPLTASDSVMLIKYHKDKKTFTFERLIKDKENYKCNYLEHSINLNDAIYILGALIEYNKCTRAVIIEVVNNICKNYYYGDTLIENYLVPLYLLKIDNQKVLGVNYRKSMNDKHVYKHLYLNNKSNEVDKEVDLNIDVNRFSPINRAVAFGSDTLFFLQYAKKPDQKKPWIITHQPVVTSYSLKQNKVISVQDFGVKQFYSNGNYGLQVLQKTLDNNIIVATQSIKRDTIKNQYLNLGRLSKLNRDNKIIWQREYSMYDVTKDSASYHHYISDVHELPDSSFIVYGFCGDYANGGWLNAWIFKIDKDGKLMELDTTTVVKWETEKPRGLSIYPNPSTDQIYINQDDLVEADITIVSTNGQFQKSINAFSSHSSHVVDISTLPVGIYFIKVVTKDKKVYNGRFVKN